MQQVDPSRPRLVIAAAALVLAIAIVSAALFHSSPLFGPIVTAISTCIYAFTLVAVIWYTVETRRMQRSVARQAEESVRQTKEIARQLRLSIMPSFVARIRADTGYAYSVLEVTNVGNGVATNVEIEPIEVHPEFDKPDVVVVVFDRVLALHTHEPTTVNHSGYDQGGEEVVPVPDILKYVWGQGAVIHRYSLLIEFQDIEGNRHRQSIEMGAGGCIANAVETLTA